MRLMRLVTGAGLALVLTASGQVLAQSSNQNNNMGSATSRQSSSDSGGNSSSANQDSGIARQASAIRTRVKGDIANAKPAGRNTHEAEAFENVGSSQMEKGNYAFAITDFRSAERALGSKEAQNEKASDPPTAPENGGQSGQTARNEESGNFQNENPGDSNGDWTQPSGAGNQNSHAGVSQNNQNENQPRDAWTLQQHVQDEINRLSTQLSDARSFEAQGQQELDKGDQAAAARCFRAAGRALNVTNNGSQRRLSEEIAHRLQYEVSRDLAQAKAKGENVSDAEWFDHKGTEQLDNGKFDSARRDFRAAELAMGIPVEVGYAQVWTTVVPVPDSSATNAQGEPSNGQSGSQQSSSNHASSSNNSGDAGNSAD